MQDATSTPLSVDWTARVLCVLVMMIGGQAVGEGVEHPHAPQVSVEVGETAGKPTVAVEAGTRLPAAEGSYGAVGVTVKGTGDHTNHKSSIAEPVAKAEPIAASERLPLGQPRFASSGVDDVHQPTNPAWVMKTVMALGLVLGLILLGRYALMAAGRRAGPTGGSAIEVLGRQGVGAKQSVILLRVGHRVLVVGDSGGGLRTLADLDDPEEVSTVLASSATVGTTSITRGFNDLVSRFTNDYPGEDGVVEEVDTADDEAGRARGQVKGLLSKIRDRNRGVGFGGM